MKLENKTSSAEIDRAQLIQNLKDHMKDFVLHPKLVRVLKGWKQGSNVIHFANLKDESNWMERINALERVKGLLYVTSSFLFKAQIKK